MSESASRPAKPITEAGPYTAAQREAFLKGTSAETKLAPHHRHQMLEKGNRLVEVEPGIWIDPGF